MIMPFVFVFLLLLDAEIYKMQLAALQVCKARLFHVQAYVVCIYLEGALKTYF